LRYTDEALVAAAQLSYNKLVRLSLVCLKLWRSRYVPPVFDASKS
jgi:hypothetical protein